MTTLEEINQNLREICPSLAKKIRQCSSDEEALELLYTSLSAIIISFTDGLSTLFDTWFPSEQERQSDLK